MKSVLIIGGGPSGLVAAKTLLQRPGNPFKVTIFESANRVGGMWRATADEPGEKCAPSMRTNLSRFTVSFSDLSWETLTIVTRHDRAESTPREPPIFPKAHQVGQYLQKYAEKFIPEQVLLLNREVVHARLEKGRSQNWTVSSIDKTTQTTYQDSFDYVIVASGFFERPRNKSLDTSAKDIPRQHSSQFRAVSALSGTPGKVVVIGGGISGSEAAAAAAFQISDAKYGPGKTKPAWAETRVYHVLDKPFYCLPFYLPINPHDATIQDSRLAPNFLPLDLVLYNLSRRGQGLISASNGPVPPEKARKGHEFIRSVIGGDQRELGYPGLVYTPDQTEYPSYTGISDTYSEFVRSGLIVPIQGRAERLVDGTKLEISHKGHRASTTENSSSSTGVLEDVVGIIEATGYEARLEYLDEEVKKALDYDPSCYRVPILLSRGSIFNPNVPSLAFVGFYEGPYWGVMEQQARLIAETWAPANSVGRSSFTTDTTDSLKLREALKRRDLSVPQFWMADYIGLMEELAREVGIERSDSVFPQQTGPVFPARYGDQQQAGNDPMSTMQEVHDLVEASSTGSRFVAAAAFRGMQGDWLLRRKIDSRHPSSPGGVLKGTAHFHPRYPTAPDFDAEYLYIEEGTFTMDNGFSFPATRRYIYRYNASKDQISTWFVQEDGESAERIFNELEFERPPEGNKEKGWLAKSSHWCSPDTYKSSCEFRFRGAALRSFGITYDVAGPSKDYTHESWYERPSPAAN
jgi:hypothetical protein